MARRVADQFADTLAAAGVKRVYGIVGDCLNGLTDAMRQQGKIEWPHVRHEEIAAFAAGAEAHLTGELAVCAGSCGLGNLHLINGLSDCHRSRNALCAAAIAHNNDRYSLGGESVERFLLGHHAGFTIVRDAVRYSAVAPPRLNPISCQCELRVTSRS